MAYLVCYCWISVLLYMNKMMLQIGEVWRLFESLFHPLLKLLEVEGCTNKISMVVVEIQLEGIIIGIINSSINNNEVQHF